jgi:hypothetical protein
VLEAHLPRVPCQRAHVTDQLEGGQWPVALAGEGSLQGHGSPNLQMQPRLTARTEGVQCDEGSFSIGELLPISFFSAVSHSARERPPAVHMGGLSRAASCFPVAG